MRASTKKYLALLNPIDLLKTKKVLHVNPTVENKRDVLKETQLSLFVYSPDAVATHQNILLKDLGKLMNLQNNNWLNVDIVKKDVVEKLSSLFNIHPLIAEDILSENQRPKIDEIDDQIYCVLQMLYYNDMENSIENEQVSFVLGKNFLVTFQDDESRDHFDGIREKLQINSSKCRNYQVDYLLYSLLDTIVDQYYNVMEKLGASIEQLEENISKGQADQFTMNRINSLRKEMILYRRNIVPARDLISNLVSIENPLIAEKNKRYFKDVQDHIEQAVDLSENYRDVVANIRDLYINQVNLKSNEVMKFLTIVTALLAPATVIGGIFGMNFEKIPYLHNVYGFWLAVGLMLIIPVIMLWWFRRKGWF
jgi:magnesium transporter